MRLSSLKFDTDGVEIRRGILAREDIEAVKAEISLGCEKLRQHGIRNLEKRFSCIAHLAASPHILAIANDLLRSPPRLVRALFFDKTADMNWFVSWHQDKTVTLNKKCEMAGWRAWSLKDNVCHVQPPSAVLDEMITFRMHVDDADEDNGCLKVIPGSHRFGILKQDEIIRLTSGSTPIACVVAAGDAVIMRPHVMHSSSKSLRQAHRRVVHLEYSSHSLPTGIDWA